MAEIIYLTAMAVVILLIILVLVVIAAYHKLLKLQQAAINYQVQLGERIQFAWHALKEQNEGLESDIILSKESSLNEIQAQYNLLLQHEAVLTAGEKEELKSEDDIRALILAYNNATETYNQAVKKFPKNIVAALFQLRPHPFFEG